MRLFVDSVEVGGGTTTLNYGGPAEALYNQYWVNIGAFGGFNSLGGNSGFTGDIDNVRIAELNACPADPCLTLACDDGNACNGVETCNRPSLGRRHAAHLRRRQRLQRRRDLRPASSCAPGTAPTCDDSDDCTAFDSRDPSRGATTSTTARVRAPTRALTWLILGGVEFLLIILSIIHLRTHSVAMT